MTTPNRFADAPNLEQIIAEAIDHVQFKLDAYELEAATASVVAAIRDSGLTVIALPEGEADDDGQVWFDDFDIRVDTTGRREDIHLYVNGEPRSPDAARHHASALLAAAQVADGGAP